MWQQNFIDTNHKSKSKKKTNKQEIQDNGTGKETCSNEKINDTGLQEDKNNDNDNNNNNNDKNNKNNNSNKPNHCCYCDLVAMFH